MIVVTGTLRSGTSLTMQTLGLLGIPIVGEKFSEENTAVECNPKGYWELPIDEVKNGIITDKYKGKCIKLLGGTITRTDPGVVDKLIVCHRNRPECVDSIKKWLGKEDFLKITPTLKNANLFYDYCYWSAFEFATVFEGNVLDVCYEEYLVYPTKTVKMIAKFVDKKFKKKAVDNIDRRF